MGHIGYWSAFVRVCPSPTRAGDEQIHPPRRRASNVRIYTRSRRVSLCPPDGTLYACMCYGAFVHSWTTQRSGGQGEYKASGSIKGPSFLRVS